MPINFSQFVFQPRPLQQYDFGQGFRDIIEARRGRENTDLLKKQNEDVNTRYAADFARDRGNREHDKALERYKKQLETAEMMRKALRGNDQAAARALAPTLQELGGTYRVEDTGDPNLPDYYIETGQAPGLGAYDVQGARRQIFGGNIASPQQVGQPFQMRSNVGPNQAYAERGGTPKNLFEFLPGASAAAAGPLQGSAPTYPGREGMLRPESAGPVAEQLTGPNPTTPQALSPYRISMRDVVKQNQAQTQPLYDAFTESLPAGEWRERMRPLATGAIAGGYSPERTKELANPLITQSVDLMQSEAQQDVARASMGLRQQGQEFSQNQRLTDRADRRIKEVSTVYKLPAAIQAYEDSKNVLTNIDKAVAGNGIAAKEAVVGMIKLNQDRISDADVRSFSQAAFGVFSDLEMGAEEFLRGGFSLPRAQGMREVARVYVKNIESRFRQIQQQMLTPIYANKSLSPEERDMYLGAAARLIPREYWDPVVKQYMGIEEEPAGPRSAASSGPPAGDNLGVAPLPRPIQRATPVARPKVSPNGVPLVKGSGAKPERDPAKMTDEQLDNMGEGELMEMYRNRLKAKAKK